MKLRKMAMVCLLNTMEIYVIKFPVEASVMRFYFIHFCEARVQYLVILNRHYKKLCIKLVSKAFFLHL
jgi:hypothetical protein